MEEAIDLRTRKHYEKLKHTVKKLENLERLLCRLDYQCNIHNHIVGAVREVDEDLLDQMPIDDKDMPDWLDSIANEKIKKGLSPAKIYKNWIINYKRAVALLPQTLSEVSGLPLDKSIFECCVLSGARSHDLVIENAPKIVNHLESSKDIAKNLESLEQTLSEGFAKQNTKLDRIYFLNNFFNSNEAILHEMASSISSVETMIKFEMEHLEETIPDVKAEKDKHTELEDKSDIFIRWDRSYVEFVNPGNKGGCSSAARNENNRVPEADYAREETGRRRRPLPQSRRLRAQRRHRARS